MEFENTISSSVTTSFAPSISSAPSLGGGIESSFSFADTVPLSAPSEISLGGIFDPSFTSFSDLIQYSFNRGESQFLDSSLITQNDNNTKVEIPEAFQVGLAEINLDPDLPNYEIPQVFYNAFADEDLLDPQQYFEQINIVDLSKPEPQNNIIEQINYSIDPEIAKTEAKLTEFFGETPAAPKPEILDRNIEEFTEEVQALTAQPFVIPSEVEDRAWESTKFVEDCHVANAPRNDNLVETALIHAGAKPEAAEQTMIQIKTGTKIAAEVESKIELKFVVDERALAERNTALKPAINNALIELKDGRIVVDPIKAAANLPREPEKRTLISEILPKYQIDLFGLENGDGSYREAVDHISSLSNLDPNTFLQRGSEIFENLPPVKIALTGKAVREIDVDRVRSYKQDSVRSFRQLTTLTNTNTMV